ncbi:hypothetical protein [Pelagicoccus albus]|uniref:Porin n=1 Tax=Pelagicoccus albus TaxID=415222 RepID=A0A7X1B2N4_9BACT|nr:hypothetical protein [Pelagicoccus albus]MBC2604525.1 hypothetical protein [Pelagicoccus albus]
MNRKTVISIAAGAALAVNSFAAGDISYGGFFSNGYLQSSANNYLVDSEDGDFDFVELGVNASWSPIERTTLRGQLFTFELGPYGNFDPIIDYLFVEYSQSPAFNLRLGRVKRPQGLYNDIQDIDIARTSILLPMGMYDQRYRDFSASADGISISGNLSFGTFQSLDYTAYHGASSLEIDGGIAGYAHTITARSLLNGKIDTIDADTLSGIQLWWNTPVAGLRTGAAYSILKGIDIDTSGNHPLYGIPIVVSNLTEASEWRFSGEYYWENWTFTGEYNVLATNGLEQQTVAGNPMGWAPVANTGHSWYLGAARRFLDRFEGSVIYSEFLSNNDSTETALDYQEDLQFSLRYDATDFWTVKGEFHLLSGQNRLFNQFGQNPSPTDENWTLFALKSTFFF